MLDRVLDALITPLTYLISYMVDFKVENFNCEYGISNILFNQSRF